MIINTRKNKLLLVLLPLNKFINRFIFLSADGTDAGASQLLGELDSAFLFSYAVSMFISGFIAERVNLRYFLSLGMLMSGVFSYLFGIAKTYDIHELSYYILVQVGTLLLKKNVEFWDDMIFTLFCWLLGSCWYFPNNWLAWCRYCC